ncbi:Transmembrane protein 26-like, partial [Homarus americanus]
FCPSVFLYLVSVVPPIWLMELGLNDLRFNSTQEIKTTDNKFSEIGGLKLDLALPIEQWVRVLEQVLLVMLLVGRWLLPKGKLTREQLSQLLLAYMAMAADIIELFECFKEDAVTRNVELIYATLGIWSWSLLQFTLVLSATYAPKPRPSINYPPPQEITLENTNLVNYCDRDGRRASQATCAYNINLYLDMDIIAILTTVFMQDGPFFLLRQVMTLIFGYKVVSYLNIFFTCKNTLVVSLQLYRLFVLCSRKRLFNRKRRELLNKLRTPSETSEEAENTSVEESVKIDQNNVPLPPPDDLVIDQALEESLLEIIEQVGEENIIKELENLVGLPAEPETQTGNSLTSLHDVNERVSTQASRKVSMMCSQPKCEECVEEDYSPPDSGFPNCNSPPSNCRKTIKRQQSVSKRNQEYIKRMENLQNYFEGSDCASYSDTDMPNDQRGISVSSTSLVDPYTDNRRHGWNIIRERYLTNDHQQQGEWRGSSVPTSLHRDSYRQGTHPPAMTPFLPHLDSYSPQPLRRGRQATSLKVGGGGGSRVLQRSSSTTMGSSLHRHHSVSMNEYFPHKYTCISESDADTLETNV